MSPIKRRRMCHWLCIVGAMIGLVGTGLGALASPSVLQQTPARGEELRIDGFIEIVFDHEMDPASVEEAWSISPRVEGAFDWPDAQTLRFAPTSQWSRDTTYHASLEATARSASGEPLGHKVDLAFTTVGFLDISQMIPTPDSDEIATDSQIFIMFNRPVVPLMTLSDPSAADLPTPLVFEPFIAGTGEWVNTSMYVFTPSSPLSGGTVYTVTLLAGLTDTTGGILAKDVVWQFTTERPKIVWMSPRSNEDLVPVDMTLRFTFNMPVSLESVHERIVLRTTGLIGDLFSERVAGELTAEGNDILFTPDQPLDFNQSYVILLEAGVTGVNGGLGMIDSISARFETVPLPRIISTDPSHGESDASPYTSFVINFNAPIDPDSVLDNITILPEPDPDEISGYFRSWDNAYVIRFGSEPSQDYEIRIGPDITDPYGNRTDQSMIVRFKTRALDPTAWLHVPGQTGTFSTYEDARVFVAHRNTDSLTMTLSRLSLDEYFEATTNWYDYTPPRSSLVRKWQIPVSGDLNAIAYTPVDLLDQGSSLEPGVYLIDLAASGVQWNRWQHRHLLIASSVNLTMKSADEETLVWACDLSSGEPIPGLILRSYDSDGDELEATITDRDGIAMFSGNDAYDWRGITVASAAPFVVGHSQWTSGLSIWEFGYSSGGSTAQRVFVDTDRPIYRPGQTVSFRGVLRNEDDAIYSLPSLNTVQITIRDPNWELVYEEDHALNAMGTLTGELLLADDAAIGTYRIEIETETSYYTETFDVAAYRAPEFEVSVTPEADQIVQGDSARALVQVDYFFGAPVVDQSVTWSVYSEVYNFSPAHLGRFTFGDRDNPWVCWSCWWVPRTAPTPILEGTGRTNASGQLLIELPDNFDVEREDGELPGSRLLTIEATARGADGQVLSGRATITLHAADIYVGLAAATSVARAGDATEIEVVSVDWEGDRVALQTASYQIIRREWENVFEANESGSGEWTWTVHDIDVESGLLETDATGSGQFSFTPPEGGTYKILVMANDEHGRETRSSLFLWATGPETVSWRRSNDDRFTLIPDKTEYEVGDVAQILIPSPYTEPHWALLTLERGGILYREVMLLESNSSVIEIPITSDHIPNLYVSVVLFQGLQAAQSAADGGTVSAGTKVGYASLTVSRDPRTLNIVMKPSEEAPLPSTEITYDVWVTDTYGNPVKTALSFDLVDAAVLTLRPRTPHAILNAFYGYRGLGVSTASGLTISINRLVAEQLDEFDDFEADKMAEDSVGAVFAPMTLAEEAGGAEPTEMLRNSAAEKLPEGITLRENFQDTAFWDGGITTDETGYARIIVQLPDNLTTWIARAVGATAATEVGESTAELLVTKPLLIRPVTPRFFVVGDRTRLLANVSNQTDSDLQAEVTLAHVGLLVEEDAVQTITIPAGGEAAIEWWCTVQDVPVVDVAFSVVSGDLSDAARPRLSTGPEGTLLVFKYTSPEIVGTAGQLDDPGQRVETIALHPNADLSQSELSLRFETSLAAAMQQGLNYLEHFEYECTEQVISRFLPNVLTLRSLQQLGIENQELTDKLPDLVAEGLEKLSSRQNGDGGWGWWDDDSSSPYLTAYAVYSLLQAERADFSIKPNMIDDGLEFLRDSLVSQQHLTSYVSANRQAWIAYVLAEGGRLSDAREAAEVLFDYRTKLSHYARAWLALTLQLTDGVGSAIDTLLSDLYSSAIVSATGVHWEESDYDWWAMNTDTRSTAIILDALVRLDPDQPLLPNVVRWLMVARKDGIWETTQETAWALIALTDWMVATDELAPTYDFTASLNDVELIEGQTGGQPLDDPIQLIVKADELNAGTSNELSISRGDGSGRLYYTAHLATYVPVDDIDALQRGIIVQRQYVSPSCPIGETCSELESVAAGDEIQVRLTIIAPHDLYYVVVEDPFPAGCEAIDPSLATTSLAATEPGLYRDSSDDWSWMSWWWWRWYSRSEFRDEKVALFADFLPSGTYTFQYSLRAVTPGEYGVLPAIAQEFYFPEVFGRSSGRSLQIEVAEDGAQ